MKTSTVKPMKKTFLLFVFTFATLAGAYAQTSDLAQKQAVKKLDWLLGEWTGEAVTNMGNQKSTVKMRETIKSMQGGNMLLITGLGSEKDSVVHDALAVVSYDGQKQKYRWTAWRPPGGYYSEVEIKVGEKSFEWQTDVQGGKTRYKAFLNEKEQWIETGEFSKDSIKWYLFLTMTMNRVK